MTTQPEALRMADWLDETETDYLEPLDHVASELRRLHALNAELLAELENCVDLLVMCFSNAPVDSCIGAAIKNGNAAIEAVHGIKGEA